MLSVLTLIISVGKYVLKNFSQFDPLYLLKKLQAAEAEGSSTESSSKGK